MRDKNVVKPAPGTRKCNCKQKVVTHQIGPGMFQQYTQQVRGRCQQCNGWLLGLSLRMQQVRARWQCYGVCVCGCGACACGTVHSSCCTQL